MTKTYVVTPSGTVLRIGSVVLVHLADNGVFAGTVDSFEADGTVAVIQPNRDPVRDVFPQGYRLDQAQWKTNLTIIAEEPW